MGKPSKQRRGNEVSECIKSQRQSEVRMAAMGKGCVKRSTLVRQRKNGALRRKAKAMPCSATSRLGNVRKATHGRGEAQKV